LPVQDDVERRLPGLVRGNREQKMLAVRGVRPGDATLLRWHLNRNSGAPA